MAHRLHLILDERDHARFRAGADAERVSLAQWLRDAGRERLERVRPPRLTTVQDLQAFWADCDAREVGREPDWEEHLAVIERSRRGPWDPT